LPEQIHERKHVDELGSKWKQEYVMV
jgi:hypothetical protein